MAGFLGEGAPVYEIRDHAGPCSDMLVRNSSLAEAMVAAMGDAPVVLMRGHGATAVGRNISEAVFHAIYTEWNARIQAQALALGSPEYLTREEAAAAALANEGQIERAWDFWKEQENDDE